MINTITSKQLVSLFKDIKNANSEEKICFIIGSGASRSSGIRTGAELSKEWFNDIKSRFPETDFNKWITDKKIDINNLPAFYGDIYDKRFSIKPSLGFDFLNKEMENKEPSFGYTVLSQLMTETVHNVVITTNFDNLIEYSLYIYSGKQPLICGHELLAGYANASLSRPLIIKIHRDRLLYPFNDTDHLQKLQQAWITPLNKLFADRALVVIGYGGNDGSLMGFLKQITNFQGIFWCGRKNSNLQLEVKNLLNEKNGNLVEIIGFDELMFELQAAMGFDLLSKKIKAEAEKRAKAYEDTVNKITKESSASQNPELKEAAKEMPEKIEEESPWKYIWESYGTDDIQKKQQILKLGLSKFPESSLINGEFASFLYDNKLNNDEAEKHYKKALEIDPGNAIDNGNYAIFLKDIRKNYDEAEKYYKKALEKVPDDAGHYGNYAIFLKDIRKNYNEAEKYYKKALEIEPNRASINCNYATFLCDIRKNYDEAEKHYKKALEIEPNHANINDSYAIFLKDIRKNYDEVEKHYKKALEIEPGNANNNGNYAGFLLARGRKSEADKFLDTALQYWTKDNLLIELLFYRYAHYPESLNEAKQRIEELLQKGVRSPGWNFDDNIRQAIKEGHPEPEELKRLADLIGNE